MGREWGRPRQFSCAIHYFGGVLHLELSVKVMGCALVQTCCKTLGLARTCYFGLQFEDSKGRPVWLKPHRRVLAQTTDPNKPLFLLVKYYPVGVECLSGSEALLVYRQCREAVLSSSVYCPPELSLLLASYSLQAEYSDSPPWPLLTPASLVPRSARQVRPRMSDAGWVSAVKAWHADHRGLSPSAAVLEYLRLAQSLSTYGVSYFSVGWLGSTVHLGVSPHGLAVYVDSRVVPKVALRWVHIKHLRRSCTRLTIRPVVGSSPDLVFVAGGRRLRQIYSLAVGYYRLHRARTEAGAARVVVQPVQPDSISHSSKEQLPALEEEIVTVEEILAK